MSADNTREKILQQNMLNLFDYIEILDTRIKVLEEEIMRYDFGYDPVETLSRRLQQKYDEGGTKLWKDKFAMDKPDKVEENKYTQHPEEILSVKTKSLPTLEARKQWMDKRGYKIEDEEISDTGKVHLKGNYGSTWKEVYHKQVAKDNNLWEPLT